MTFTDIRFKPDFFEKFSDKGFPFIKGKIFYMTNKLYTFEQFRAVKTLRKNRKFLNVAKVKNKIFLQ